MYDVEPQAGFEFALHGADVHEVPRPPPYQGGDLTGLSYWGIRDANPMCD